LTQSFAREFQPAGIHVAHIILDGIVDTAQSRALHKMDPLKMMSPDDIAETFWQIANQPQSVWSHEIDLRPQSEAF
jgi:NADP-dependent 3-hydroxy acid dehydrogenase YdfG